MNLGIAYGNRHQRTEDKADLNKAIQYLQESINLSPLVHPNRSRQRLNLGTGFYDRYQRTSERADLNMAISHLLDSIHQTPLDHLDRARRLFTLGNRYHERYTITGDIKDLDAVIQHLQKSLDHATSPTRDRLEAAIYLLSIYATANSWKRPMESLTPSCGWCHCWLLNSFTTPTNSIYSLQLLA
jgi:tetratricopeptide (TPR) repeat protein